MLPLLRPEPILRPKARPVHGEVPPAKAAEALRQGQTLQVTDHFRTGLAILEALAEVLPPAPPAAPYAVRRDAWRAYRDASQRLLVAIVDQRVDVGGAGPLPFGAELYSDQRDFFLPLTQVQELHGAWIRYEKGVHLAVLGRKLHPFHGTYVPSRTSHLELFATWLSGWKGGREQAVDVGTGCGVLALMLAKAGFAHVRATDANPNAVESLARDLRRVPVASRVTLDHCDLLGNPPKGWADLIVFNPPWIQGEPIGPVKRALEYEDPALFERFFAQAATALRSQGRVVMLWSTIGQLVRPDIPNPLEVELAREEPRFKLESKLTRRVKSAKGQRKTKEKVEVWELSLASP